MVSNSAVPLAAGVVSASGTVSVTDATQAAVAGLAAVPPATDVALPQLPAGVDLGAAAGPHGKEHP